MWFVCAREIALRIHKIPLNYGYVTMRRYKSILTIITYTNLQDERALGRLKDMLDFEEK